MNKDADSRFLPNGEYRHLVNGRVLDSDDSNSGVIENLSGTLLVCDEPLLFSGFKAIGLYEKDNFLYYFFCRNGFGTVIGRYDIEKKSQEYIFLDLSLGMRNLNDGYLNTVCFLKSAGGQSGTVFSRALQEGFGWYVPSRVELAEFMAIVGIDTYWSSTEYDDRAAYQSDAYGYFQLSDKSSSGKLVIIRKFRFEDRAVPSFGATLYKEYADQGIAYEYKILPGSYIYGTGTYFSQHLIPFTEETLLSGIHLYKGMLYFHDRHVNAPYKINISRSKADFSYYATENDLMVVKAPPAMPTITSKAEIGKVESFRGIVPQFALRYEYEDGEVSAISPYSGVPFNLEDLSEEDLKDFTSVNTFNFTSGKLIRMVSTDGKSFTSSEIAFKDSDGNPISIGSRNDTFGCGAARNNGMVVGSVGNHGSGQRLNRYPFVLMPDGNNYILFTNASNIIWSSAAVSADGGNALYMSNNEDDFVSIWRLDTTGSYPKLIKVKDIEGGYGSASGRWRHCAMGSSGNVCYAVSAPSLWRSLSGGKQDAEWAIVAKFGDIFAGIDGVFRHVCCSSDGSVVYVVGGARRLGVSRDYGKTWESVDLNTEYDMHDISDLDCSADGRSVFVCGAGVVLSHNFGKSFTRASGLSEANPLYSIACSDLGDIVFVTELKTGSPLRVSRNGGVDFKESSGSGQINGVTDIFFSARGFVESLSDNTTQNRTTEVAINYNTGSRHVKRIQLLMRSGANMYKIATIEKDGLPDYSIEQFVFRNQGTYPQVASKDRDKLYDNVPLRTRTSKIVQNALMFGGYSDGHSVEQRVDATIEIGVAVGYRGDVSLKGGSVQSYGIIYYDDFNRSSSVLEIGDVEVPAVTQSLSTPVRIATITINSKAPEWATKYKIARKNPNIRFWGINGFGAAFVHNSKIYLDITLATDIVPAAGDDLELVYEISGSGTNLGMTFQVAGYEDSVSYEGEQSLPKGRYLVVENPVVNGDPVAGYSIDDVQTDTSLYVSSYFYLIKRDISEDGKAYQEIPLEFPVMPGGFHYGNVKSQSARASAVVNLIGDGDVILLTNPTREINRLLGGAIFTTLGRPNAVIDNFSERDRFAGLCVSEPYVDDTGYNGLSSFNLGLINYKDLDEEHGEIELIDGYDTDVDVFQRERCSKIMYRKNILTSASGERQVVSSQDIFGEQQMYSGEWGMSDFRSYATWGNNSYFVDKRKGAVLRKSMSGLDSISRYGLDDFLFDLILKESVFKGCFDLRHESYILCLHDKSINFLEKGNGWSSFFEMVPDFIVNSQHGVYSFKDGVLYKNDAQPDLCRIYGNGSDVVVHFVYNEYPDIVKLFNAITLEASDVPYRTEFITEAALSVIDGSAWERKEKLFHAYIPMGAGERSAEYNMAGVCSKQYYGSEIPLHYQQKRGIHVGDELYSTDSSGSNKVFVGKVSGVHDGILNIDRMGTVQAGAILVCADVSQINGDNHRDRYMEIRMYFRPSGRLLVKSVQVDVDESKV